MFFSANQLANEKNFQASKTPCNICVWTLRFLFLCAVLSNSLNNKTVTVHFKSKNVFVFLPNWVHTAKTESEFWRLEPPISLNMACLAWVHSTSWRASGKKEKIIIVGYTYNVRPFLFWASPYFVRASEFRWTMNQ